MTMTTPESRAEAARAWVAKLEPFVRPDLKHEDILEDSLADGLEILVRTLRNKLLLCTVCVNKPTQRSRDGRTQDIQVS